MSIHSKARAEQQGRAENYARRSGYKRGGAVSDEDQDRAMVKKAVAEHEEHDHKGEAKTKLRIKRGGRVEGKEPKTRLDKRARGGQVGKKAPVNVIVNSGGGEGEKQEAAQAGMRQGMQMGAVMGARAAAAKMGGGAGGPPGPMPTAPMPGGPPPGGLPIAPRPPMAGPPGAPPMRAKGGALKLETGSGGGAARLQKHAALEGHRGEEASETVKVRAHKRRKSGGAV